MVRNLKSGLRQSLKPSLAGGLGDGDIFTTASLDLNFAKYKNLGPVDATTGSSLVTFTRASSGTYVGSDGLIKTATTNEPRFDHDPTTGESLGLLVEEQRTNLLLRSEQFDDAGWGKGGSSITPNAITGPDGLTSADKIVESTTLDLHYVFQSISVTAGVVYTLSVYMKAAERTEGALNLSSFNSAFPANADAYFNLSTGVIIVSGAGLTSSAITAFPNGWYRCTITATAQATTSAIINSGGISNSGSNYYTGDGASGIYLGGAQLEAGAFPTSYIPTTASTVTRAADVASITGSAFSGWYRQDEGTVFAHWSSAAERLSWAISNADTFNDSMYQSTLASTAGNVTRTAVITAGIGQAGLSTGVYIPNSMRRSAFSFKTDDFAAVSDGGDLELDTTGSVPPADRLYLGSNWAGSSLYLSGHLRRLAFWPQRLPNSTLQTITQ